MSIPATKPGSATSAQIMNNTATLGRTTASSTG